MKFFYYAALAIPAVMAATQNMQDMQAQQMEIAGKVGTLEATVKKTCPDLPKECSASLEKLLSGVKTGISSGNGLKDVKQSVSTFSMELKKNKDCTSKLTECLKKVAPALRGAHGAAM
ncbi:hypothetical protein QQS21_002374 [Conoideocrella luteorostrata]|uniref:Uncharacterized protein n=1 Tax=Conoideocrella luteorostrata TaxID=1105319 RepID=A0AAJ0CZH9_9HYPO|nr:hypothetical protein QQS21_002374 [Conoideocrella luteorostrata]